MFCLRIFHVLMVFPLSSETDLLFLLSDAKNFEAVSQRVQVPFVSLRMGLNGESHLRMDVDIVE